MTSHNNEGSTENIMESSADNTKLMAIFAYIGPLIIVSYLMAKGNPFVKFHVKQGAILFLAWIVLFTFGGMLFFIYPLIKIVQLAIGIFAIIGIINAAQGKEKPLPLIGHLTKHFNI